MLWRFLLLADGSVRDRLFWCGYAAFRNESTSREIITGRYLEPVVGHSDEPKESTELTRRCH